MKRNFILFVAFLFFAVLGGCQFPSFVPQQASEEQNLPGDEIKDVPRSQTADFAFQTLLPVDLSLTVNLSGKKDSITAAPAVIVRLLNKNGSVVYTGKTKEDGTLETRLQLPAAPEDMTLTLKAPGYSERRVVIGDISTYSLVKRTITISRKDTKVSASEYSIPDTDGDGVPDVYDAFPTDPNSAFAENIPADGSLTISFEDLFGQAQAGDADYNDFLAQYTITLIKNGDGDVTRLQGSAHAVTKLAGYNHRFGIRISPFNGDAVLNVSYADKAGGIMPGGISGRIVNGGADITLFQSTKFSIGCATTFSLDFSQPQTAAQIDQPPYNPYLYVYNTKHDIHLIGEDALPNSANPGDSFRDAEGFPWALLVPDTWVPPEETQRIEVPYPRFTDWRLSNGTLSMDWYQGGSAPPNTPPAAVFNDYEVSGAGTAGVNGFYRENGINEGFPKYDRVGGVYFMYYLTADDYGGTPVWAIQDQIVGTLDTAQYYDSRTPATPPAGDWSTLLGSLPNAMVSRSAITGTAAVGGTITGVYVFSDADGDSEGSTTIQWFRFANSTSTTGGTAIPGATSASYTCASGDAGQFLRMRITPVDSRGATGTPVFSGAIPISAS